MTRPDFGLPDSGPGPRHRGYADLDELMRQVARGDQEAFEGVYGLLAGPVFGVISRVVRDPAQAEEVAQEVLLEVWQTAARFDPRRGGAVTWIMTIAHRRAIDRIRSSTAQTQREQKVGPRFAGEPADTAETVEARLDAERVRRCLDSLTGLQRESVTLAYYGGYSYPQVAGVLGVAVGTIKTRIRDGLIRMRDCLGVSW